jgi:hypothetical protein
VLSDTFKVEKHGKHCELASILLEAPIQKQHFSFDSES